MIPYTMESLTSSKFAVVVNIYMTSENVSIKPY